MCLGVLDGMCNQSMSSNRSNHHIHHGFSTTAAVLTGGVSLRATAPLWSLAFRAVLLNSAIYRGPDFSLASFWSISWRGGCNSGVRRMGLRFFIVVVALSDLRSEVSASGRKRWNRPLQLCTPTPSLIQIPQLAGNNNTNNSLAIGNCTPVHCTWYSY